MFLLSVINDELSVFWADNLYIVKFKSDANQKSTSEFKYFLVFGPLNRVQVDTLFEHFPKW